MPKLRELIGSPRQEVKLPSIVGERCVHSIIETASCKACVEACPRDAWLLDDDALSLDAGACDGCGLCVPACTEGAIHHRHEIMLGEWKGKRLALCACEQAGISGAEGVIPCIHAVGVQDILRLQQKGFTQLVVSSADCDACQCGSGIRLAERVDAINSALQQSAYPDLALHHQSAGAWSRLRNEISELAAAQRLSRRGFLQGLVNADLPQGVELFALSNDDETPFISPGALLSEPTHSTIWPYVPSIDSRLCNGCDACSRLCPHAAIVLEEHNEQFRYRLNPAKCSGCRICIDLCEEHAVHLYQWQAQGEGEVALRHSRCSVCGNAFHRPLEQSSESDSVCRICAKHNHCKNLYQVLS